MNTVFIAKEYYYDHDLILGVYDTFEKAENACKQYAKESGFAYGDYCVIKIPMNRPATKKEVYYNESRNFTKVEV